MADKLLVLNLEDSAIDSELIAAKLYEDGLDFELVRVENESDFVSALEGTVFDLVLADYSLPTFDGLTALKITLERRPEVPFIFVSGAIGEDLAAEVLKCGATDFVLKKPDVQTCSGCQEGLAGRGRARRTEAPGSRKGTIDR